MGGSSLGGLEPRVSWGQHTRDRAWAAAAEASGGQGNAATVALQQQLAAERSKRLAAEQALASKAKTESGGTAAQEESTRSSDPFKDKVGGKTTRKTWDKFKKISVASNVVKSVTLARTVLTRVKVEKTDHHRNPPKAAEETISFT